MIAPLSFGIAAVLALHLGSAVSLHAQGTRAPASATPAATARDTTQAAARSAAASIQREVFTYNAAGRRDPFVSLAQTSDLRPLITDLQLVGILAEPGGRRSVAVLRDRSQAGRQYRVTVGSTLGRLRVTRITSKDVTFSIEEFGRNRQEVLGYAADTTRTRP